MSWGKAGAGIHRNLEEMSEVGLMSGDSQPGFPYCQGEYREVFLADPHWAQTFALFSCFLTGDIANAGYRRHKICFHKLPSESVTLTY